MMIEKILRRLLRLHKWPKLLPGPVKRAPSANAYVASEGQWYLPALAGPETFLPSCKGTPVVREVISVLERLSSDRYLEFVMKFYGAGLEKFGEQWQYADINPAS